MYPLILLPGMTCDSALWSSQISVLSRDFSIFAIHDFYRHDSLNGMARQVLHAAPPRFALAGHSMGARVAFEILRIAPERIERVALFDVTASEETVDDRARERLVNLARTQGPVALVTRWLPAILHPRRLQDRELIDRLTEMFCRATPEIYARHVNAVLTRPDYRWLLPKIACPTLVACGSHDLLCPVARHQLMAAYIPRSRLAIIPDCGHMATFEAPDVVSGLLRAWLQA